MKYYLDSLVIEVTRRCNMNCAHCLRGEAQNMDIDYKYIDVLLKDVASIGNVTFSGGEPSLNVAAMEYVLEKCKELYIPVGSFYVVTNGKTNPLALVLTCLKWYAYCDDEDDICGVALSRDMFHDDIPREHEILLRGLSFFREDKFTDFNHQSIINEGRGADLGGFNMIDQASRHSDFYYDDWDKDEWRIESTIYVSANGDVKTDCDVAYDNDDYTIGNLGKDSLHYLMQTQAIEKNGFLPI